MSKIHIVIDQGTGYGYSGDPDGGGFGAGVDWGDGNGSGNKEDSCVAYANKHMSANIFSAKHDSFYGCGDGYGNGNGYGDGSDEGPIRAVNLDWLSNYDTSEKV